MAGKSYRVVIVGGGISGSALAYVLSRYSDTGSIAVLEKYDRLAPLNSSARNNSQTLHCGDIETNYSLEKAVQVRRQASMIEYYARQVDENDFLFKYPKMVLAVGDEECEQLADRHERFAEGFPYMERWDARRIAEVEPEVANLDGKPRPEPILASGTTEDFSAVNYGRLTESFMRSARAINDQLDLHVNTRVERIREAEGGYRLETNRGEMQADFVVTAAGAHSLLMAHQMGHGLDKSILPVAGSFYYTPNILNGKVYTIQNDKLPFAAIHGDPDLVEPNKTRFGPTALILPKLERYTGGTYLDFWRTLSLDRMVAKVFIDLFRDRDIRNYILRNMAFEIPGVRKRLFLKDVRKIVPGLRLDQLEFAHRIGGLRPQIIDKSQGKLNLGESTIQPEGQRLIFNITPSPGATTCLGNAYRDAQIVCGQLGIDFHKDAIEADLLDGRPL